jgi:hypothetical protein
LSDLDVVVPNQFEAHFCFCVNVFILAHNRMKNPIQHNEKHMHPLPGAETPKPNSPQTSVPPDNAAGSGLHDASCCASDSQILDWLDELVKSGSVFRLWGEGKPGISYYVGGLIPNDFIHANPEDYLFRDIVKHLMARQKNATHTPSNRS